YTVHDVVISLFVDKTPIYTKENTLQGYMVYLINATELRNKDAQIEYHATHDELTGLLNRFAIQNKIQQALNNREPFAIVLFDVNKFNDINKIDVALGDEYLQVIAHRLESIFPHNEIAHVSGDEFIILFPDITKEALQQTLQEALELLSPPIVLNEYEFLQQYTFSVTRYPDDGDDSDILWQNLLITIEHAKATNTKIAFFKKSFVDIIHLESKRKEEIRRALAARDVLNAYQPRIDMKTRKIVAFEALARIRSIDGTIQLPSEFIAEAEYSNLIQELGTHVLYNACLYATKLRDILPHIVISVNISPKQFSMELLYIIDSVIQQSGIQPQQLELEITESVMIRDIKKARTILEQLTSRGIAIAIDDFGKGYSSLYYIKDLPINTLKIDKDFTQDALTNPRSAAIVRTVIALGNDLGMQVVAEGIETKEQFDAIQAYHCTQLQGDYISPPLLEEQAFTWIEEQELHQNTMDSYY
ncbi:MAG: bifunctional diguanylate cyclase/phosphodiesterase, partial [Desulfovibrionaceae bacterium]|nr:bifunctional diguanylate cyclase/phosphodiesterase [Desulfovibrionaceae bacterium]